MRKDIHVGKFILSTTLYTLKYISTYIYFEYYITLIRITNILNKAFYLATFIEILLLVIV